MLLTPEHRTMLHDGSAIALELIQQRGYQSLDQPADLIDRGFSKAQAKTAPALGIPLWDVHGQRHGWQIRPDAPRQMADGKVNKYETPAKGHNILDVHPHVQPLLADPTVPLWITEGVKKGDSLVSHGACAIAFPGGVWGFRGTNEHGGKVILPDWDYIALNDRQVYVVYDSDIYHKPNVEQALKKLYAMLRQRQAIPGLVRWPEQYRAQKVGVDDFLAQGHTLDDVLTMVPPMGPLPPKPPRAATAADGAPVVPLPTIEVDTDMAGVVDEAQKALLHLPKAPVVFQRARRLCVIAQGVKPPPWLHRPPDMPISLEASTAHLRELMSQAAHWVKFNKRTQEPEDTLPPTWAVEALQGRPHWPFPPLEGIVYSPTLRPDGSILDIPGYDRDTGLYLHLGETPFPSVPTRPTLDDARSALGQLQEVFQDFLFAAPEATPGEKYDPTKNPSFSATIAGVLTLVGRSAIQGNIPLLGVTATAPGSGKGKLVDAITLIATGRGVSKMGQTLDDNEELKRLLALALAGVSVCCIDNVIHPLGNQYLDMALTAGSITGRILGQTATVEAPWNAVMFATGNNLAYRGDMARRVVPISLDPKMEKPEERQDFRHPDLEAWVQQQRPRLVVAALTILRAYVVAGKPDQGLTPYGSFEAWSALVRNAVVWLGESDPCEGRKNLAAQTDGAYERLAVLLAAWEACFPIKANGTFQARTLNQAKQEIALYAVEKDQVRNTWDELRDALAAFDRRYDGRSFDINRVGNALRSVEGRVIGLRNDKGVLIGNMRLKRCGEYRHNALWRVEKV
jgi:hypothetical protein